MSSSSADKTDIYKSRKIQSFTHNEKDFSDRENEMISLYGNMENFEVFYNRMKEIGENSIFIKNCLEYELKIRPKQKETICSLLQIPPEKCFKKGAAESAIIEDNVIEFIKIVESHDFKPKLKLWKSKYDPIYFVTENLNISKKRAIAVSYMQLMAFYGSINCLKYVIASQNKSFDDKNLEKYAVAGGNIEMIKLLEHQGVRFDNCFEVSIKYHRDDISNWLLRNYQCDPVNICDSILYFNIRAFFFSLKNNLFFDNNLINDAVFLCTVKRNIALCKYLVDECHSDPDGIRVTQNRSNKTVRTTSLNVACHNNDLILVKYLTKECNVNIEREDDEERTALQIACRKNLFDITRFLVEECNANTEKIDGRALYKASKEGNLDFVKYLVEKLHVDVNKGIKVKHQYFTTKRKAIHIACEKGYYEIVKCLVSEGHANVEEKNENGMTALHIACEKGNFDIVKYLIEKGHANVEKKTKTYFLSKYYKRTALHIATVNGYFDIVKYLVEEGHANVEEKGENKKTAVFYASRKGHQKIVDYLVDKCHANAILCYDDDSSDDDIFEDCSSDKRNDDRPDDDESIDSSW